MPHAEYSPSADNRKPPEQPSESAHSSSTTLPPGKEPPRTRLTSGSKEEHNLVDDVAAFVKRFVFLKESSIYTLVALWAIGTYLHKEFDFFGYLFAYSPEPESGKTTLLDVLDLLVANTGGVEVSTTEANLFRTASTNTQLLDEIDNWREKEALKSVLNSGFKQGGVVKRQEPIAGAGYRTRSFPVYGPKAMAGIGLKSSLDRVTLSRTFSISMVRRKPSEYREKLKPRLVKADAEQLQKRITEWTSANRKKVADVYDSGAFPYLQQFGDRAKDIAQPLAAILEVACDGNETRAKKMRGSLVDAVKKTREEQQSSTPEHKILRHLLHLAKEDDPLIGNASELVPHCANLAEPPDAGTISRVLRNYEFKTESKRLNGDDPRWRYVLKAERLQEIVDRYALESDDHTEPKELASE